LRRPNRTRHPMPRAQARRRFLSRICEPLLVLNRPRQFRRSRPKLSIRLSVRLCRKRRQLRLLCPAAEIAAATDLNVPAPDVARATVEPVVILYVPGIPAPPPAISSPERAEIAQTEELGTLVVDPPKNRANSWETTVRDKLPAATLPPVSFTATAEQTIKSSPISLPSGAEAASAEGLQSQSTAAFANIPSGTPFSEAREILLSNGWRPREISAFERPELIRYMESAHIEAGHSEVVNCNDAVRALCRFEYVDGSERITTLLSVGKTVEEALIVDVFEMQIRSPIQ